MTKHTLGLLTSVAASVMCLNAQPIFDRITAVSLIYERISFSWDESLTDRITVMTAPAACFHNPYEAMYLSLKGSGLRLFQRPPETGVGIEVGEETESCGFECTPDIDVPVADWK
jgi:hypothetical protein